MQDIERLKGSPNLRVTEGPENRSIFFGFDVGSPELASSDVKGKNPFADVRVRQAVNMAINRQAIQRVVMRGQSVPAGAIVAAVRQRLQEGVRQRRAARRRQGQGAARRGRLSERLLGVAALPERPLSQRRGDLPGRGRHARPDRHQGEPGLAVEVAALPDAAEPEDRLLPARLGRADLRQRLHLQLPLSHARRHAAAAGTRRAIPTRKSTS